MPQVGSEHAFPFAPAVLRRFVLTFGLASLVLVLVVAVVYRQEVRHQRVILEQEARHVLELQREFLSFEFQAVQSDLLYLAAQEVLQDFHADGVAARNRLEAEYIRFAEKKATYDQIRFLDTSGKEAVRINFRNGRAQAVAQDELQSKTTRYYFQRALALDAGDVFVSPFDLNVEHGEIERPIKPVIRFLTPVFDDAGRIRGYLVLNYLGAPLLAHLKQIAAGFRGETMLVNSVGEYLQASEARREWAWMLGGELSFRTDFPTAWIQGRNLQVGQVSAGQDLFAFLRVSPLRRTTANDAPDSEVERAPDASDLILVTRVSSPLAAARSNHLLNQLILLSTGVLGVSAVLLFYWARFGVLREVQQQRTVESESRLRELSSLLLAAQESERRNLSRDLHDNLGQQVTALKLDLRSLAKKSDSKDADPLLHRAIDQADQLLKCLHEIATRVRPSVLDDLGLPDAVESFLAAYEQRTGIAVNAELNFRRTNVPAAIGENVYRVLQEALVNVARHAKVNEADVIMETNDDLLRLCVSDPGVGFDEETPRHSNRLGILGMRERVELLGGRFELKSALGAGTQVTVTLPLEKKNP